MRLITSLLALIAVAAGLSSTAAQPKVGYARKPAVNDPFFNPPAHYGSLPHGSLLKHRKVDVSGLNISVPLHGAYQILYSSYDPINDIPFSTPATILVPLGNTAAYTKAKHGEKLVNKISSHQVAYDAAFKNCGPSYLLANNSHADFTGDELFVLEALLAQNVTVLVPDYEGPRGAFDIGPVEGHGVLDAVLATLEFSEVVPQRHNVEVVLDGYSGGAIATGWALQQQPRYAPELRKHIVGGAFGGLPSNATADFLKLDGSLASGLIVLAVTAQSNTFSSIRRYLDEHLNQRGRDAIALAEKTCLSTLMQTYPFTSFFEAFTDVTTAEALAAPAVAGPFSQLVLGKPGTDVPDVPILLYSSEADEIVPHEDTTRYFHDICVRGDQSAHLINVIGTSHVDTFIDIFPRFALPYIVERFAGAPAAPGCTESTFDPLAV